VRALAVAQAPSAIIPQLFHVHKRAGLGVLRACRKTRPARHSRPSSHESCRRPLQNSAETIEGGVDGPVALSPAIISLRLDAAVCVSTPAHYRRYLSIARYALLLRYIPILSSFALLAAISAFTLHSLATVILLLAFLTA
jgi:hypothetical protein